MAHKWLSLRKCLLCPAGVSFLEGKEDIFEDWREKFFNTWKVRKAPAASGEGKSPSLHTLLPAHDQINLDCATAAFAQRARRPGASRVSQSCQRASGRLAAEILPNVNHSVMLLKCPDKASWSCYTHSRLPIATIYFIAGKAECLKNGRVTH